MIKQIIRFEVVARASHINYVFNNSTNEFDEEGCDDGKECYYWTSKEEMLSDFFKNFNVNEFRNSLDANFQLRKITEKWTREEVDDEWDYDSSESKVILEFNEYDWLKNNGLAI